VFVRLIRQRGGRPRGEKGGTIKPFYYFLEENRGKEGYAKRGTQSQAEPTKGWGGGSRVFLTEMVGE